MAATQATRRSARRAGTTRRTAKTQNTLQEPAPQAHDEPPRTTATVNNTPTRTPPRSGSTAEGGVPDIRRGLAAACDDVAESCGTTQNTAHMVIGNARRRPQMTKTNADGQR